MSLPAIITSKLSKLIPRLASNHDGEVVATARAIERTLASEGRDFHDLARAVTERDFRPRPRRSSGPTRWRNLLYSGDKVMALDAIKGLKLSPWERQFVASIDGLLRRNPCASITPRQAQVLDDMLIRVWEAGNGA